MTIRRTDSLRVTVSAERRTLEHFADLIARVSDLQAHPGNVNENIPDGYIRVHAETVTQADRYESIAETVRRIERDA
jgi:hypothetical protein